MLSRSVFCGVLPGWGWSGRMEDAVLHGCIPVILQDGVHAPWETHLDWRRYALRLPRAQMPELLHLLRAISPSRRQRMQAALADVWPRFAYLDVVVQEERRARTAYEADGFAPGDARSIWSRAAEAHAARDATATLLDALDARLERARPQREASSSPATAVGRTVDSSGGSDLLACVSDVHGAHRGRPPPSDVGMGPRFENRVINGWRI